MTSEPYTLGAWRVKEGQQEAFIAAWRDLAAFALSLPTPAGPGLLVQKIDDEQEFYSFGPWPSLEAIQGFRDHPDTPTHIGKLLEFCESGRPGTYRVAATSP